MEDNPGGGSRFRFTVPDELGVPSHLDLPGLSPTPPGLAVRPRLPGGHPLAGPSGGGGWAAGDLDVLLVEDDDDHARLVDETLAGAEGAYRLRRVRDLAGAPDRAPTATAPT